MRPGMLRAARRPWPRGMRRVCRRPSKRRSRLPGRRPRHPHSPVSGRWKVALTSYHPPQITVASYWQERLAVCIWTHSSALVARKPQSFVMPAAVIADEALTALEGKDRELEAKTATIERLSAELRSQTESVSKLAAEVCPQVASTADMLHERHNRFELPVKQEYLLCRLAAPLRQANRLGLGYYVQTLICLYILYSWHTGRSRK